MIKFFLVGGVVSVLSLTAPLAAQSQPPLTAPQWYAQETAPASVTPQELEKFANTIKELRTIGQEAEKQMARAVEAQGLTPERFLAISEIQSNPNDTEAKDISALEKKQFEQALKKVQDIAQQTQAKQRQALEEQGLGVERFQEIGKQIEQNPSLQEEVRSLLQ